MTDPRSFTIAFLPAGRSEVEERTYLADGSSPDQALEDALWRLMGAGCDPIEARAFDGEIIWADTSRW